MSSLPPISVREATQFQRLVSQWRSLGADAVEWAVLGLPREPGKEGGVGGFLESGVERISSIERELAAMNLHLSGNRALDFGCGPGRFSLALSHHYHEVVGVDVSQSMIDLASKISGTQVGLSYRLNDAPDLTQFESSQFDLVFSAYVLQHLPEWLALRYIHEFARILSPGGILILQDHGYPNSRVLRIIPPAWVIGGANWMRRVRGTHARRSLNARWDDYWIPPRKARNAFASAGLEVHSVKEDPKPDGKLVSFWFVAIKPAVPSPLISKPTHTAE